jgi:transcriptional antiterminator RfaH
MSSKKSYILVKSKPNQDEIALKNLGRQNFEFFQPTFKTISRVKNKFKEIIKPVFPGYIFIAINLEEKNWYKINNTRGVSSIIVFGNEIPLINSELIEELKDRFSLNSTLKDDNSFEVGMNAKISNGPFAQLNGRIEQIDADQRVWILLDILGNQTRVSISKLNLMPKNN